MEWKEIQGTIASISKRFIKTHVTLPSKTQHGKLQPKTKPAYGNPPVFESILDATKGVLEINNETAIRKLVGKKGIYTSEDHCRTVMKIFLYNAKITIVSPETYYEGCAITCPHRNCTRKLMFHAVSKSVSGLSTY